MTLTSALFSLLNRAVLNPGSPYRITLTRGLEVAFKLRPAGDVIMQLSRTKPSKPSHQELSTCLNAIYLDHPTTYTHILSEIKEFEDGDRNFIQVFFAPPSHEYKEVV